MSWLTQLYDTYNRCEDLVDKKVDGQPTLLPIHHDIRHAQIEVTLSSSDTFLSAARIEKEDCETAIPITENSASRSSNPAPHPLLDTLPYLAGDLSTFYTAKKDLHKEFYEPYMAQLDAWIAHGAPAPVKSLYNYLSKQTLAHDLVNTGVLVCKDGQITNEKIQATEQYKAFVRFVLVDDFGVQHPLWLDRTIHQSYVNYVADNPTSKPALCYATGKHTVLASKHGKNIRRAGDGAKLISANDKGNFTYRGRFTTPEEASGISYEVSEKAHQALRWLIRKQGWRRGDYAFVAWSTGGDEVPNPLDHSYDMMDIWGTVEENAIPDTRKNFAKNLGKALSGHQHSLTNSAVNILGMNAATPGRLSVIYWRELHTEDFLARLEHWHKNAAWYHRFYRNEGDGAEKKSVLIEFIGAPAPRDIALTAYGHQAGGSYLEMDDKLLIATINRLLPCIIDRARMPYDLVRACVNNTSRPQAVNTTLFHKMVSTACSVIRKYRFDMFKEEWGMELDSTNPLHRDRSYLFGRLLALADQVEHRYYFINEIKRPTAAMRYMEAFSKKPGHLWKIIREQIQPYLMKLSPPEQAYFKKLEQDITCLLQPEDLISRKPLNELYLLGYNVQRQTFMTKKETANDSEEA